MCFYPLVVWQPHDNVLDDGQRSFKLILQQIPNFWYHRQMEEGLDDKIHIVGDIIYAFHMWQNVFKIFITTPIWFTLKHKKTWMLLKHKLQNILKLTRSLTTKEPHCLINFHLFNFNCSKEYIIMNLNWSLCYMLQKK